MQISSLAKGTAEDGTTPSKPSASMLAIHKYRGGPQWPDGGACYDQHVINDENLECAICVLEY